MGSSGSQSWGTQVIYDSVRGSEIWWCMHSAHSLSTTLRTYKVISNSLLPQLWSVQPVMPCIWALDPFDGHQFRRTDPHNHTTTSPIFATPGAPCKTARFPSYVWCYLNNLGSRRLSIILSLLSFRLRVRLSSYILLAWLARIFYQMFTYSHHTCNFICRKLIINGALLKVLLKYHIRGPVADGFQIYLSPSTDESSFSIRRIKGMGWNCIHTESILPRNAFAL